MSSQPEDGKLQLDNLYAITKYSGEMLGRRYGQLGHRPVASVRLAAVYGPQERSTVSRSRTSQVHQLHAALRQGRAVRVAGAGVVRDWTYAVDAARAVEGLLLAERGNYDTYNVGCGCGITFGQLVEAFVARGLRAEWVPDPAAADIAMRPGQARTPLDISRLRHDTGFTPCYNLDSGDRRLSAVLISEFANPSSDGFSSADPPVHRLKSGCREAENAPTPSAYGQCLHQGWQTAGRQGPASER